MNNRLLEIIKYKTGGHQTKFAHLMGWSPQYLAKLLNGVNFGMQPTLSILEAMPEINARWFLFGSGEMLEVGQLYNIQREAFAHVQSLLEFEKYIPYMSPEELHTFEQSLTGRKLPDFSPATLTKWQERMNDRERELDAKFSQAKKESDRLCRQQTAKK